MILRERYKVLRSLKSGGMGAVYLAEDQRLGSSLCAVKAMLDAVKGDPIIARKFQSESVVLSQLQHPGIPRVRDYFVEAETAFIVMDYIEGDNLEQKGQLLPAEVVVPIALEVLEILVYLHGLPAPVVHCDIKPANIIREKETARIKLVDFGLARPVTDEKTQTVAGTLGYSAVEQLRGHAEPRSDLYSLGVTMYHLLTGKLPTFLLVPPILESLPDLHPGLAAIVDKATRMEAEQRFQSAQEMRQQLLDWVARPPDAQPAPPRRGANWRALFHPGKVPPAGQMPVFQEPCRHCRQPAPSDQGQCPHCRQALATESVPLGQALWESSRFMAQQPSRLGPTLFLVGLLLVSLHYAERAVAFWPVPLSLLAGLLLTLMLGYAAAVTLQRLRAGRPGLPELGDGLLHLKRGLKSLLLTICLWGVPCLTLALPLLGSLWMWKQGQSFYVLPAVVLGLLMMVMSIRPFFLWPWAWAALVDRDHLASALDAAANLQKRAFRQQAGVLLLVAHLALWLSLSWGLLHSPLWPLALLPTAWGMLASADLLGCVYRSQGARQLADWPGSYRSVLGPTPAHFERLPAGKPQLLAVALALATALCLLFGCLLPSLDRRRYPALGPNLQFGLINGNGWMSVSPRFDSIFPFQEGSPATPASFRGQWGYLRRNGDWLVYPRLAAAFPFSDGLSRFREGELWGYLDAGGKTVITPRFQDAADFHEGLAAARKNDLWGYVDARGTFQIGPLFYFPPGPFHDGHARVERGQPRFYESMHPQNFIDKHGLFLNRDSYMQAGDFSQGKAPVLVNLNWTFLDDQGRPGSLQVKKLRSYREDRAAFSDGSKWGFLDEDGRTAIPPQFKEVGDFHEGLACVSDGQHLGYINKEGKSWRPLDLDGASSFQEGVALVRLQSDIGYLNRRGRIFWHRHVAGSPEQVQSVWLNYLHIHRDPRQEATYGLIPSP